ncbi:hypothetical protein C8R43DRAFT_982299 [Mycena crocata]|nr:hypothetical protein C8R43DRAFT_982299 [Mycena crocata]
MSSPAKRQRTENAPITRSNIWHKDGSVVLQVENTQFRVHWGPNVDGCPVIDLPDAMVDVEYLLKALYTPTYLAQQALPLLAVAALIRLGRKYDFRDLLDSALERLTFENPSTLEEYDARLATNGSYSPTRIIYDNGIFMDTLTLARENSILSVLPCAYYRATQRHYGAKLVNGTSRGDGTRSSLAPVDQCKCLVGHTKLLKAQIQPGFPQAWIRSWPANENCTNPTQCAKVRDASIRTYLDNLSLLALSQLVLGRSLCNSCAARIGAMGVDGRKKVWDELPSFFDLPPWGELKNNL